MALKPKIQLSGLSSTATSFLLTEVTGNYSSTNVGGYNTPNVTRGAIVSLLIQLYNEGNAEAILGFKPDDITDFIAGDPQTISVGTFDKTGSFTDGVIHVKYHSLMAAVILTSKSTDGLTINSASSFKGNESVVVIGTTAYRVDTTASNTPSTLKLLDAIPDDATTVLPGYTGAAHILNNKHLSSQLSKKIGIYAGESCNDIVGLFLTKILLKKVGSEVRYDCNDIKGAQAIITTAINDLEEDCKC